MSHYRIIKQTYESGGCTWIIQKRSRIPGIWLTYGTMDDYYGISPWSLFKSSGIRYHSLDSAKQGVEELIESEKKDTVISEDIIEI